jgi:hypothetical protein
VLRAAGPPYPMLRSVRQRGQGKGREGERRCLTQIPFPSHRLPETVVGRGYLKPDGIYTPSEQRTPAWLSRPGAVNLKTTPK